jgi:Holliday junction resolvasome RuvABC endonuclease subunit
MRIMGVDPSITCTGVSLPDATTMAIKPRSSGDDRLREIADHLHVAAVGCGAELVVMEGLFGVYKGEAARVIPMLHGALRLELQRLPVPYVVLNPKTLKRFATGDGNADKAKMAQAARVHLGRAYGTSDECDADWCRIAGRTVYGRPEVTDHPGPAMAMDRILSLPQEQVSALRSGLKGQPVEWPVVGRHVPWPRVALRTTS